MKKLFLLFLLAFAFTPFLYAAPATENTSFYFAVIDQPALSNDIRLQAEIDRIRPQTLAFVVTNGVRAEDEPCTDSLYRERKNLFEESDKSLFLSLAGSDWIGCKSEDEADIRIERLQRLREILFEADHSFGMVSTPLTRQSSSARYADFPENTYWEYGNILFVTLHLPASNNHYLNAAGRNNEFEERLMANLYWLKRVFMLAERNSHSAIVIFCDGNPFSEEKKLAPASRDGFQEIRQLINKLAGDFPGKVLLVHGEAIEKNHDIQWKSNLGIVGAGSKWLDIGVFPDTKNLFLVGDPPTVKKKKRR